MLVGAAEGQPLGLHLRVRVEYVRYGGPVPGVPDAVGGYEVPQLLAVVTAP